MKIETYMYHTFSIVDRRLPLDFYNGDFLVLVKIVELSVKIVFLTILSKNGPNFIDNVEIFF